jgi:hypothetical protein
MQKTNEKYIKVRQVKWLPDKQIFCACSVIDIACMEIGNLKVDYLHELEAV